MRPRWLPLIGALALQTTPFCIAGPASARPQEAPRGNEGGQASGPSQQPAVRLAVDAIAVDVQVIDRTGRPVPGLGAEKFSVTVNGRRRRVVSAAFIPTPPSGTSSASGASGAPIPSANPVAGAPAEGRIIMLAIDCLSFSPGVARRATDAAREFVKRLPPDDRIGLFAFPVGPDIDATTDRDLIARGLDAVVGQREVALVGRFRLRPSEVIDIASEMPQEDGPILLSVAQRECAGTDDGPCIKRLSLDVTSTALYYEAQANVSLGGLRSLLTKMSRLPGRKTVLLVSGGLIASDRPGGRPDVSDIGIVAGKEAARANTAVYTLHIDTTDEDTYGAQMRLLHKDASNLRRDTEVRSRWLENFSGAAGGAFFRVIGSGGESTYDRILAETSSYYLLGVEPAEADRSGLPQEIRVKVGQRNVTVRSRRWVSMPKDSAISRPALNTATVGPSTPVVTTAPAPLAASRPLPGELQPLADAFARGDYAAMHRELDATRDLANMIRGFRMADRPWPEAPRRASVFALELSMAGLRSDNGHARDQGARLLAEYNARVRQPAGADDFECAWLWAEAAALTGLLQPDMTMAFVRRALTRCPNEPRLNLAAAVVAEQRWVATRQRSEAEAADVIRQYEVAMKFPETALESRARAAWLLHRLGKSADAIDLLEGHAGVESDRYARYLAELIRGQLLRSVGREADAAAALRAALVTWPGAQAARVALMTLLFSRGERQEAAGLAQAIESSTDHDFDPWWTYWSGDYRAHPAIIDRLRELSRAQ